MSVHKVRYDLGTLGYLLGLAKPDDKTPFKPGDFVYFNGHPDYVNRHPKGMSRGENTFFIGYNDDGQRLYVGFGELFKSGPRPLRFKAASLKLILTPQKM